MMNVFNGQTLHHNILVFALRYYVRMQQFEKTVSRQRINRRAAKLNKETAGEKQYQL